MVAPRWRALRLEVEFAVPRVELLAVTGDRWFRPGDADPDCCPPQGREMEAVPRFLAAPRRGARSRGGSRPSTRGRAEPSCGANAARRAWGRALARRRGDRRRDGSAARRSSGRPVRAGLGGAHDSWRRAGAARTHSRAAIRGGRQRARRRARRRRRCRDPLAAERARAVVRAGVARPHGRGGASAAAHPCGGARVVGGEPRRKRSSVASTCPGQRSRLPTRGARGSRGRSRNRSGLDSARRDKRLMSAKASWARQIVACGNERLTTRVTI